MFNPLNAQLNPICHLLALLGAHYIFHVSGLRVKHTRCRLHLKTTLTEWENAKGDARLEGRKNIMSNSYKWFSVHFVFKIWPFHTIPLWFYDFYLSIYPSGFITAVAVFRKPNAIPLCFSIDLFLNLLLSWLLVLLPSTFFLDVLFFFSPVLVSHRAPPLVADRGTLTRYGGYRGNKIPGVDQN